MSNRLERVNSEVQKSLSKILSNELRDPRIKALVTITKVEVSADFSHAKIFVSLLGANANEESQTFEILKSSASFIRKSLSQKLNLRLTPELHFFIDDAWKEGERMEKIISSLNIPKEN